MSQIVLFILFIYNCFIFSSIAVYTFFLFITVPTVIYSSISDQKSFDEFILIVLRVRVLGKGCALPPLHTHTHTRTHARTHTQHIIIVFAFPGSQ